MMKNNTEFITLVNIKSVRCFTIYGQCSEHKVKHVKLFDEKRHSVVIRSTEDFCKDQTFFDESYSIKYAGRPLTVEQYWPFRTNTNTIHIAKRAIPIQFQYQYNQLKLQILTYESWVFEGLVIETAWKWFLAKNEFNIHLILPYVFFVAWVKTYFIMKYTLYRVIKSK